MNEELTTQPAIAGQTIAAQTATETFTIRFDPALNSEGKTTGDLTGDAAKTLLTLMEEKIAMITSLSGVLGSGKKAIFKGKLIIVVDPADVT